MRKTVQNINKKTCIDIQVAGIINMKIKQIIRQIMPEFIKKKLKKTIAVKSNTEMIKKYKKIQPYCRGKFSKGINLIGDIRADTGLGQSMRILADMLERCKVPFVIIQIDTVEKRKLGTSKWENHITDKAVYSINLIHINPEGWSKTYNKLEKVILDYRYNIAFWLWELEVFPDEWVSNIETINEIWVPSDFIKNSITAKASKPIHKIPYFINIEKKNLYDRKYFNLPEDKFLFLLMYDSRSISERKNPTGVIKAYKEAFSIEENNIGLIIKINHSENEKKLRELKKDLREYHNIYYIYDKLSRTEIESLVYDADVLVSLHRSEGYGLPLAEAMYLRTPVIATNWSANVEFMDERSACLVRYNLVQINKTIGPYKRGNTWADADSSHAAEYMKRLFYDKKFYLDILESAENKISNNEALEIIRERVERIFRI